MEHLTKTYIGIDISKHKFDVAYFEDNSKKAIKISYEYTDEGMQLLLSKMPLDGHFVMEFTGIYHLKLLLFLQEQSRLVSMVTGEQVRYFAKMGNNMSKTDGQDALLICQYAITHQPKVFKIVDEQELYLKQKKTYLQGLYKEKRHFLNQLESFKSSPKQDSKTIERLGKMLSFIEEQEQEIGEEINKYLHDNYEDGLKNLQSIDGVGEKIAIEFISAVSSFQGFEEDKSGKAFIKYLGLAPTLYQSGTSVKRKSVLPKRAYTVLRDKLFMPILGLCTGKNRKKGEIFRTYYNGLRARGKSVKQALLATIHKVVRIMIAVFKSGQSFDIDLYGKMPKEQILVTE